MYTHTLDKLLLTIILCVCNSIIFAGGVYQGPDAFIKETFKKEPYEKKVIWPNKILQQQMAEILGHKYKGLRIRYWINGTKTAWILNEIGKEKPITTGIVIDKNMIERVKILVFRESRGWEIRHAFFTDQFRHAFLKDNKQLNQSVDNISGATLSVRAVTKLSRIALLLHKHIVPDS